MMIYTHRGSHRYHTHTPEDEEVADELMEHSEDLREPREDGELGGDNCCYGDERG